MGRRACRPTRGLNNFDVIRYEYYRDRDVAFEGFTGKNYAVPRGVHLAHLGDALRLPGGPRRAREARRAEGRDAVRRAGLVHQHPPARNSRTVQLREALIYAFDFEWTNRTIMYGSYDRTHSVFQNSDMMATGKPSDDELKILEPFRGKVPDEVFGEPFVPPVSDGSGNDRNAAAARLAAAAPRPAIRSRTASASGRNGERIDDRVPAG